ncbi:hypothetical protein HXX76_002043 [Chlamydomonas incerta]|uniref:Nucleoside phosphorylase domain-containing protein n=1 Tax=Chlamydomonas incerta TaxID=51695 RepID=A0A835WAB3_CHLIN|nr:hypothetical protein HXX76_002043 [Chlamydomonas incerta]|eukprot:KAG2443695.1 hypothetical protein HXX76_002043 [Chlamydomonas incerta]
MPVSCAAPNCGAGPAPSCRCCGPNDASRPRRRRFILYLFFFWSLAILLAHLIVPQWYGAQRAPRPAAGFGLPDPDAGPRPLFGGAAGAGGAGSWGGKGGKGAPYVPSRAEVCEDYLGVPGLDLAAAGGFSLVLTADPGDFSGTPEAHHIIANLKHKVIKPRSSSVCGGLYFGELMGQPALVVTTGIGPTAAGLCTQELLAACGASATELIYFGTSGWSPQLGGVLNPPDCGAANPGRKITRVGDICISPVSVNWVCKKSTWTLQSQGFPNQCFRPQEVAGPNATALYGECLFATDNLDANLALADSLAAAARSVRGRAALPTRNDLVTDLEQKYWGLMSEGTGVTYPPVSGEDMPVVWDYTQCAEVDGQFFFTGAPWEIKARDYAAQAISTALGFAQPGSGLRDSVDATEVIAVSAMEGVGVAEALEKYHRLDSTPRRIPYTNVRTLSNWIHHPVGRKPGSSGAAGEWEIYQEVPEDYVNGYAYAIATGSVTILSLFQQRCLAGLQLGVIAAADPEQGQLLAAALRRHGLGGLALWAQQGGAAGAAGAAASTAREGAEGGSAAAAAAALGGRRGAAGAGLAGAGAAWAEELAKKAKLCTFTVDYA